MAKVVCVLYDDPVTGYPKSYARKDLPHLDRYPDGQVLPTPGAIDFTPGELLGSVSGALGLKKYLKRLGHQLVVTSDKDRPNSVLDKELVDAEIVISQPFWPAYLTAARIAKAPKLKLAITAGIGSDHVDLQAAIEPTARRGWCCAGAPRDRAARDARPSGRSPHAPTERGRRQCASIDVPHPESPSPTHGTRLPCDGRATT